MKSMKDQISIDDVCVSSHRDNIYISFRVGFCDLTFDDVDGIEYAGACMDFEEDVYAHIPNQKRGNALKRTFVGRQTHGRIRIDVYDGDKNVNIRSLFPSASDLTDVSRPDPVYDCTYIYYLQFTVDETEWDAFVATMKEKEAMEEKMRVKGWKPPVNDTQDCENCKRSEECKGWKHRLAKKQREIAEFEAKYEHKMNELNRECEESKRRERAEVAYTNGFSCVEDFDEWIENEIEDNETRLQSKYPEQY